MPSPLRFRLSGQDGRHVPPIRHSLLMLLDIIDAIKTLAMLRVEILQREEASVEAAANLRLTYGEYGR